MLSFLEFLEESSWSKALWHSGRGDFDPAKIKPGSHFGNLGAAVDRGVNKPYDSDENSRNVIAYNYKPTGKSVRVKDDWDSDTPEHSIAGQLHKKRILKKKEADWIQNRTNYPQKAMGRLLRSRGVSDVVYKNAKEGDKSDSRIVYDTKGLSVKHNFKSPNVIEPKTVPDEKDRAGWDRFETRRNTFGVFKKRKK
jgi:hypothetical protein